MTEPLCPRCGCPEIDPRGPKHDCVRSLGARLAETERALAYAMEDIALRTGAREPPLGALWDEALRAQWEEEARRRTQNLVEGPLCFVFHHERGCHWVTWEPRT